MAVDGGVEPIDFVQTLEAEPVGSNRQHAERGNKQNGLGRHRKIQEFQIGNGDERVVMGVSTELRFPSA